jgi:anti-sigma-K factor RskA
MIILHDDDRDPRDEELFAALRAEYHQPSDSSYWAFLERRIMGRITAEGTREWWSYFPSWSRAGLAAAALALAVAGVAAWQTRKAQDVAAWHEVLESPNEMPIIESAGGERTKQREATLRYLIAR